MKRFCVLVLLAVVATSAPAQEDKEKTVKVRPGEPVVLKIVTTPASTGPGATITLRERHGHGVPVRTGLSHTGGGNLDVAQPSADTVVLTLTGTAVAGGTSFCPTRAGMNFEVEQCFEVTPDQPEKKVVKLSLEARVIGLLRSDDGKHVGAAEESGACATLTCGPSALLTLCAPAHGVAGGENLSINDHDGPVSVTVGPGKYTLHETFHISATHERALLPCKTASAEFAPDPALDPLWISYFEPFHGAQKKDFGYQVTLKVTAEDRKEEKDEKKDNGKEEEKKEKKQLPAPR
jgi:hypothetical protein